MVPIAPRPARLIAFVAAWAAVAGAEGRTDLQRLVVQPVPSGGFGAGGSETLDAGDFAVGLHLNHARNPLVVLRNGVRVERPVAGTTSFQLHAAYGVAPWAELGVSLPVVAWQSSSAPGLPAQAAGDVRVLPRLRLFEQWRDGLALSFVPGFTLPAGDAAAYAGEDAFTFLPEAAASWRDGVRAVTLSLAGRVRPTAALGNGAVVGSELGLRASYAHRVFPTLEAIAELDGGVAFASAGRGLRGNPLEVLGGGRLRLARAWAIDLAIGTALSSAPGTPDLRVVAGVTWGRDLPYQPTGACVRADGLRVRADGADADGDGLDDACDACPAAGESKNGFEDADGCPDEVPIPDTDGDGVKDPEDACVAVPGAGPHGCPDADKDGVRDADDRCGDVAGPAPAGCPDQDGDGVVDLDDACVEVAGDPVSGCPDLDADGVKDADDHCPAEPGPAPEGCPDADRDHVQDANDACPDAAEDADGFEDADGCPDPDDDQDGVPDAADQCPRDAEDADAFEDDDGCADPDNDKDGIADAADQCPLEPETINGVKDDDGCADKGKALVVVTADKIAILDKVFFRTGSDVIEKRSHGLLDQVALTMRAHRELARVRVEGHTDDAGAREKNLALSQARAEAVVRHLASRGVEEGRLFARGFASDRPLVPNVGEKNRAQNRRVEFTILNEGDAP